MSDPVRNGYIDRAGPMEQASEWLMIGEQNLSLQQRQDFEQWLEDRNNRTVYRELSRSWQLFGEAANEPKVLRWRNEALDNQYKPPRTAAWLVGGIGAIAASIALFSMGNPFQSPSLSPPVANRPAPTPIAFTTSHGEIRTETLADGSHITLDTNTRLLVTLGPDERRVTLQSGQAFFQVAQDRKRPFIVTAGDREVQAIGTQFDVHKDQANVAVLLLEGKVEVHTPKYVRHAMNVSPVHLTPGMRLQFAIANSGSQITSVDVKALTSWREGRVLFDDTPLVEATAEMTRYSSLPIEIADPRLNSVKVSGVFRLASTESFINALTLGFPVSARRENGKIKLYRKPTSG